MSNHENGLEYWAQRLHPTLALAQLVLAAKYLLQRIQRVEPPLLVFLPRR